MAITKEADKFIQEITFTTNTDPPTVTAAVQLLELSDGKDVTSADNNLGSQFVWVTATMSSAAATATLVFFIADDNSVGSLGAGKFYQDTATIAATTTRQSHSTGAGDYVATVSFAVSLKNTLDLMRFGQSWPKWYCACTALSAGTITVRVLAGRAI